MEPARRCIGELQFPADPRSRASSERQVETTPANIIRKRAVHLARLNHQCRPKQSQFTALSAVFTGEIEATKALIYALPAGDIPDREAIAVLFDNAANTALSVTLNLTVGTVVRIAERAGRPARAVFLRAAVPRAPDVDHDQRHVFVTP